MVTGSIGLTLLLLSGAETIEKRSVILMDVAGDRDVAEKATMLLLRSVRQLNRFDVKTQARSGIGDEIEKAKEKCVGDTVCVGLEISGDYEGYVLSGNVGNHHQAGSSIAFWLVDVGARGVLPKRANVPVRDRGNIQAAVDQAVEELFGRVKARIRPLRPPRNGSVRMAAKAFADASLDPGAGRDWLTDKLREEIEAIPGIELQLVPSGDRKGCDEACFRRAVRSARVPYTLIGYATKISGSEDFGTYSVSATVFDGSGREVTTANELFRGTAKQLERAIRYLALTVLGQEARRPGTIAIMAKIDSADVYIDGQKAGPLPLKPRSEYLGGRHSVRLVAEDYLDWYNEVYVIPGETTELWAVPELRPAPLYEEWWFWTVVGGAVALVGGFSYYFLNRPPETGSGLVQIE